MREAVSKIPAPDPPLRRAMNPAATILDTDWLSRVQLWRLLNSPSGKLVRYYSLPFKPTSRFHMLKFHCSLCHLSENFLADGPFVDADWWEDCDDSDSSSSSSNSMNDDGSFFSDDDESRISVNVEELQQYYEQQQQQASRNAIDAPRRKRFCNRGLQIWCQARQSWRTPSAGHRGKKKKALPIPESFRKELVKCLVERRQFELSQSIPLSCVINAYEQVWHENGCD